MIKHQLPSNQGKSQAPHQTKPYGWQRPIFKLKRVARKAQDFSMQKTIPPKSKAHQTKRQIQPKSSTPPEDKYRPLK
jgi:hypothetical protein